MDREAHLKAIEAERERQFDLPGTEGDSRKSPAEWLMTICSLLGEGYPRSGIPPSRTDFERSLVKAAAVCVAALEHINHLAENKKII